MYRAARSFILVALIATTLFAAGRFRATPGQAASGSRTLQVAASSSFKEALDRIAASYEASTGVEVVAHYDASGTLAQRIKDGAGFDVFVSASPSSIASLASMGLANSTQTIVIAGTRLAIFAPVGNPAQIALPKDLRRVSSIAIGNPDFSPDGTAAREWLRYIGLWNELESRLVLADDSIQTETYVDGGQASVGIGFAHEIRNNPSLAVVYVVPDDQLNDVHYQAVPLRHALNRRRAEQFTAYLKSPDAQAIMAECGLIPH